MDGWPLFLFPAGLLSPPPLESLVVPNDFDRTDLRADEPQLASSQIHGGTTNHRGKREDQRGWGQRKYVQARNRSTSTSPSERISTSMDLSAYPVPSRSVHHKWCRVRLSTLPFLRRQDKPFEQQIKWYQYQQRLFWKILRSVNPVHIVLGIALDRPAA